MTKMIKTVAEVDQISADIRRAARDGDHEKAHAMEDDMHEGVLRAVAQGFPNPKHSAALAKAALRSSRIQFGRSCA
jgi:hypothetical protein